MADVTRAEFAALVDRVAALEGPSPTIPPAPASPQPETERVTMSPPIVEVKGNTYTLSATLRAATPTSFVYLQLAVRGPGNPSDLATRPNTRLSAGKSMRLTGKAAGVGGTYRAWLAYSLDGIRWVDGPEVSFVLPPAVPDLVPKDAPTGAPAPETPKPAVPPLPAPDLPPAVPPPPAPKPLPPPLLGPGGPRRIPLVGRSGLPFNSLVFKQSASAAEAFGKRRGVPVDGFMYFTARQSWEDFRWHDKDHASWLDDGRILITSHPHAPEVEGDAMNAKGAQNAYSAQQRSLGKYLLDAGLNRPTHVIRVDWECNGNWYRWSANRPGGAGALAEAIKNFVKNVRAGGATQVKFDLCWNKGPSQAGTDYEIFPGPEWIDVVAIDAYDHWNAATTDAQWRAEVNKRPALAGVAKFAADNGIQWAMDEGGNVHGDHGGGDNPFYWVKLREFIDANIETCAWHVTYDDPGAPSSLRHQFDANPASFTTYKRLWAPA